MKYFKNYKEILALKSKKMSKRSVSHFIRVPHRILCPFLFDRY